MIIIFKYGNDYTTNLLTVSDNSMSGGLKKEENFFTRIAVINEERPVTYRG
jgi:hypothetical protein